MSYIPSAKGEVVKRKPIGIQDILVELEGKIVIQCDVCCLLKEDGYLTYVEISSIENDGIKTKRMITGRGRNADGTTLQMVGIVNRLRREGYLQVRVPKETPSPMAKEIQRFYHLRSKGMMA